MIEICQLSNTLIGDEETVYDPNQFYDQLVLGIKGTISVAELNVLKIRMLQGKESKAKRGELFTVVAPGYIRDGNQIVKDPNRRVQEAIMLVFKKFQELGSIRQTYGWFLENSIELPANKSVAGQIQLVWKLPAQTFIPSILHNPIYAGAYVYGRRPVEKVLEHEAVRKRQAAIRAPDQAKVFIKDHHDGYISWGTYLRHQRMIDKNGTNFQPDEAILAVREGHGLDPYTHRDADEIGVKVRCHRNSARCHRNSAVTVIPRTPRPRRPTMAAGKTLWCMSYRQSRNGLVDLLYGQ